LHTCKTSTRRGVPALRVRIAKFGAWEKERENAQKARKKKTPRGEKILAKGEKRNLSTARPKVISGRKANQENGVSLRKAWKKKGERPEAEPKT